MAAERHEVRRIDVGDGIYVRVPVPQPAGAESAVAPTQDQGPRPNASEPDAARSAPAWRVQPAAVGLGAGLALLALLRVGLTPHGVLAAGLLAVLAVLAAIDLRARVLPNRIVLPAIGVVLAWQVAFFPDRSLEWLLAAVGAAGLMLLPTLFNPGAVGMGDVKLAALLGAALGADVTAALMLGFITVVPVALVLLVRPASSLRGAAVPFGPFLAFGAAVVLLA